MGNGELAKCVQASTTNRHRIDGGRSMAYRDNRRIDNSGFYVVDHRDACDANSGWIPIRKENEWRLKGGYF
jgi:hypothetical protein